MKSRKYQIHLHKEFCLIVSSAAPRLRSVMEDFTLLFILSFWGPSGKRAVIEKNYGHNTGFLCNTCVHAIIKIYARVVSIGLIMSK